MAAAKAGQTSPQERLPLRHLPQKRVPGRVLVQVLVQVLGPTLVIVQPRHRRRQRRPPTKSPKNQRPAARLCRQHMTHWQPQWQHVLQCRLPAKRRRDTLCAWCRSK